jgi:hypothetical protein
MLLLFEAKLNSIAEPIAHRNQIKCLTNSQALDV